MTRQSLKTIVLEALAARPPGVNVARNLVRSSNLIALTIGVAKSAGREPRSSDNELAYYTPARRSTTTIRLWPVSWRENRRLHGHGILTRTSP